MTEYERALAMTRVFAEAAFNAGGSAAETWEPHIHAVADRMLDRAAKWAQVVVAECNAKVVEADGL